MKNPATMIGGGVWFCFLLWLSYYGSKCFPGLMEFVKTRVIRTEILPGYEPEISFVVWNGLISLLGWLPIFFTQNWRTTAFRTMGRDITFMVVLTGSMIFGAMMWEIIFADDFDPTLFVNPSNMAKHGWSPFQLWFVWLAFVVVANAYSAAMAYLMWRPENPGPLATSV